MLFRLGILVFDTLLRYQKITRRMSLPMGTLETQSWTQHGVQARGYVATMTGNRGQGPRKFAIIAVGRFVQFCEWDYQLQNLGPMGRVQHQGEITI